MIVTVFCVLYYCYEDAVIHHHFQEEHYLAAVFYLYAVVNACRSFSVLSRSYLVNKAKWFF